MVRLLQGLLLLLQRWVWGCWLLQLFLLLSQGQVGCVASTCAAKRRTSLPLRRAGLMCCSPPFGAQRQSQQHVLRLLCLCCLLCQLCQH